MQRCCRWRNTGREGRGWEAGGTRSGPHSGFVCNRKLQRGYSGGWGKWIQHLLPLFSLLCLVSISPSVFNKLLLHFFFSSSSFHLCVHTWGEAWCCTYACIGRVQSWSAGVFLNLFPVRFLTFLTGLGGHRFGLWTNWPPRPQDLCASPCLTFTWVQALVFMLAEQPLYLLIHLPSPSIPPSRPFFSNFHFFTSISAPFPFFLLCAQSPTYTALWRAGYRFSYGRTTHSSCDYKGTVPKAGVSVGWTALGAACTW